MPTETDSEGQEWGRFELEVHGGWAATILYEVGLCSPQGACSSWLTLSHLAQVPLMSIISECYFTTIDTRWDYVGQEEQAKQKGKALFTGGCVTSEFGTRRRRSYKAQDIIMRGLLAADKEFGGPDRGRLAGTSNVHFAQKYDIAPM